MIYVIVIFLVYMGHCCFFYSIVILILNYVRYNCLLRMIHVLWLAIHSKLCRGVYAVMLFAPLRIVLTMSHYVVSSVCSFIIGIHTMGYLRYYVIVDITLLLRMIYVL